MTALPIAYPRAIGSDIMPSTSSMTVSAVGGARESIPEPSPGCPDPAKYRVR